MAREASASRTTNPVPEQRTGEQESTADPTQTGESVGSVRLVSFDRLLSVAVLTPAQASLVAVQLLDAADDIRGTVDGQHPAGACVGAVTLMPSGDVDVGRPHADEGTRVSELLKQLLENARRLPAHPRPEQLLLLQRLEEAAGDPLIEPGARARQLEGALADTLGSGARQRLSGQLAALVDAFAHVAPSVPAPIDARPAPRPARTTPPAAIPRAASAAPGSSRAAPHRAAPARHAPSRPPRRSRALLHRRMRGGRVALVVLVLAAVLAGSGYVVLRDPGVGIVGSLGRGGHPAAPATSAPAQPSKQSAEQPRLHRPQAVPALARRHSGPITGVAVQKTGSCKPGALCPVKVTVHLSPASTTRPVAWKVGTARLCKRGIIWSPPTTVTAQPGWTTVYASSSVRVPKGRSLALIGLTTTPARAQSRPVPVTGSSSSLHC
jgi:hypothetical protein